MEFRPITRDEFFYVVQDNYDEHIELAIPLYREMHDELIRQVPRSGALRVLDLGCGTGKTSAVFLNNNSESTVHGIDLFPEMCNHASARLSRFGRRFSHQIGDMRSLDFGTGTFDVCVSSLAIHHLTPEEKRALFARIATALKGEGRFLLIDWTKFASPRMQETSAETAENHAVRSVPKAEIVKDWIDHWRTKNIPDTADELTRWLHDAGFRYADCLMRYYGIALICAEK